MNQFCPKCKEATLPKSVTENVCPNCGTPLEPVWHKAEVPDK